MTDKASSTMLYPVFSKFQKRSTGRNPSKNKRNITELEKYDIWEEKRKNRMKWSSAKKKEKLRVVTVSFKYMKACWQRAKGLFLHTHNFQEKQKGLKRNKEGLGKHYWVEWQRGCGVRALGKKKNTKSKLLKGKKPMSQQTDCLGSMWSFPITVTKLPSKTQLYSSFSLTSWPLWSFLSRCRTLLQIKKSLTWMHCLLL